MSNQEPPYYEKLPSWPDFGFVDTKIDGWIPACRVKNWEDFIERMKAPSYRIIQEEMIYRGQRRYDWKLASSLSRLPWYKNGHVPLSERKKLLKQFKLALRGRGPDFSSINNENEIWAYGQHHELDTPLLDWSQSPFVALYFAFWEQDDNESNNSRVVFCFNKSKLDEIMPEIFYEPESNEHTRLVNQTGLFTITPDNEQGEGFMSYIVNKLLQEKREEINDATSMSSYFQKIHIPNINRDECLDTLRQMNIHHGSLFPDPFGAATYTNEWIKREHLRVIVLELFEDAKDFINSFRRRSSPIAKDLHKNETNRKKILEILISDIWEKYKYSPDLQKEEIAQIIIKQADEMLIEFLEKNS